MCTYIRPDQTSVLSRGLPHVTLSVRLSDGSELRGLFADNLPSIDADFALQPDEAPTPELPMRTATADFIVPLAALRAARADAVEATVAALQKDGFVFVVLDDELSSAACTRMHVWTRRRHERRRAHGRALTRDNLSSGSAAPPGRRIVPRRPRPERQIFFPFSAHADGRCRALERIARRAPSGAAQTSSFIE